MLTQSTAWLVHEPGQRESGKHALQFGRATIRQPKDSSTPLYLD
jgi:hypothetical protein